MRLNDYLVEVTTGDAAWKKYFKDNDIETFTKKTSPVWDINSKKIDMSIEKGEPISVPSSSVFNKGKISVMYKGVPVIISFNNIVKPVTTGGERLKIQASRLVQMSTGKNVTVGSTSFPAKVFYNSTELALSITEGIQNIKTVPKDLKEILINYLSGRKYSIIDWNGYDNKKLKNEVAKYLGELIIGLCIMNNEKVTTGANPFKGQKVKEFIVPTDSSFAGVDSMFMMKNGEVIPISSKSGKGAAASFFVNVMPVLIKTNMKVPSGILKFMVDTAKSNNFKTLEWIYNVGIKYLMKPYLKGPIGKNILQNPYSLYNNFRMGNIDKNEKYIIDIVKNPKLFNKWPITRNMKTIADKMPNSFTYFMCQNLAELLNKDKKAIQTIIKALSYKNFYQANLNQSKFHSGIVEFKIVHSGSNNLKILQGKGSMGSVKTEQGRLSYQFS